MKPSSKEQQSTRIAIIGASSAIAENCARLWLDQGPVELILIGRNAQRINRVAHDLRVRQPEACIQEIIANFLSPQDIRDKVEQIFAKGPIDIVLIAHGWLPEQSLCQDDLLVCHETLEVNGVSPVLYTEACARQMAQVGKGTIVLIGSVAGDRGRKSNYTYGAAKGLIEHYVQGLQHRFASGPIHVILIKPGPTDTPMTAHCKAKGLKLTPVESVAKGIVKATKRKSSVVYLPEKWRFIMWVIRCLPRFIFNRLNI